MNYTNSWVNASLMASYITCRNICTTQVFTKQINGVSETQGKSVTYDIGTLGVTNLLNQSGASGSISAANTITDVRQLMGYKTAGSFIRPFTVGLSAVYKF